ncbi:MAG TPA: DAK2 domain-containing protein [Stellaceae bacterium]|nr:DAK2 domain-containing protein [Stellaceae bacterium]
MRRQYSQSAGAAAGGYRGGLQGLRRCLHQGLGLQPGHAAGGRLSRRCQRDCRAARDPLGDNADAAGEGDRRRVRARGAKLGDKTVLDAIEAARAAIADLADPARQHAAALAAVDAALERFRGEANRIGRARMFGDRSRGLDDPGMVAFRHMVAGLAVLESA